VSFSTLNGSNNGEVGICPAAQTMFKHVDAFIAFLGGLGTL